MDTYEPGDLKNLKKDDLERAFDTQFRSLASDLPKPTVHHRFHPTRKWELDRAWPEHLVAAEIEGGIYGRQIKCHSCGAVQRARKKDGSLGAIIRPSYGHASFSRFKTDAEKYNEAAKLGWLILRFIREDILGDPFLMVETIRFTLETRRWRISMIQELSYDERSVLRLIAAGFNTKEIADRMGRTDNAIRGISRRLCEKVVAPNRVAAVAKCLAWGLLDYDEVPFQDRFDYDVEN